MYQIGDQLVFIYEPSSDAVRFSAQARIWTPIRRKLRAFVASCGETLYLGESLERQT
jgi:hypothetical protein